MRILVAILFLMFVNAQAFAFTVPVHPSQCYPDDTGGATKVGPVEPDATSNEPTVRIDFPDGSTTTVLCAFNYPHGAPYTLGCTASLTPYGCCTGNQTGCTDIVDFDMVRYALPTGTGSVVWNVDIGCVKDGDDPGVYTYAGTSNTEDSSIDTFATTLENILDDIALNDAIDKPDHGAQCVVRIKRIGADVADSSAETATFDGGMIRIYPEN